MFNKIYKPDNRQRSRHHSRRRIRKQQEHIDTDVQVVEDAIGATLRLNYFFMLQEKGDKVLEKKRNREAARKWLYMKNFLK